MFLCNVITQLMHFVGFFKSDWKCLVAFSALLVGHILASLSKEVRRKVNVDHACAALIGLMKNSSVEVRQSTARVLGLLHAS